MNWTWLGLSAGAYLIGSIPFGFLIARSRGIDIREHGSGNIGATNVGRVLGKRLGLTCFALDVLKGLLPAFGAGVIMGLLTDASAAREQAWWWLLVSSMSIAGHMFPVWLRFKGGKGVATGLGAMLGVFPVLTIAGAGAALAWIACVKMTRMVGISSCIAAIVLAIATAVQLPFGRAGLAHVVVTAAMAALVIYKHRGNIARTLDGTEPKLGGSSPPAGIDSSQSSK